MTWADVAIAEAVLLVVLAVLVFVVARTADHAQRAHTRREDLLLNQLLHLAGRTWQPPPTPEPSLEDQDENIERYVASMSQLPDED